MTPIYVIRHGQAKHNVSDLTGGWTESSLTELGRKQVKAIAKRLTILKDSKCKLLASDLTRTRQTAEIISQEIGVQPTFHMELREFNNGIAANKNLKDVQHLHKEPSEPLLDWQPWPEGETWRSFYERVSGFLDATDYSEPTIIVTHGGTVIQILAWWLRIPVESLRNVSFHVEPASLSVLRVTSLDEHQVERLNDTLHLYEIGCLNPIPL